MGGPTFRHHILRYFMEHPDEIKYADDVAASINDGAGLDLTKKQVVNCVAAMIRDTEVLRRRFVAVVPGHAYMWKSEDSVRTSNRAADSAAVGSTVNGSSSTAPASTSTPATSSARPMVPATPVPTESPTSAEPEEAEPAAAPNEYDDDDALFVAQLAQVETKSGPARATPADVAKILEQRGHAARLRSADVPRTFTEVGTNRRGEVIVRDGNGTLWRLSLLYDDPNQV